MAIVDKDVLKGYFNNGKVPNSSHYGDLIDTIFGNNYSMIGGYLSLHGLRGFWPMSSVDENLNVLDMSGQGRHLSRVSTTINQTPTISPLIPYAAFDENRYLYRNDEPGLDITGAAGLFGVANQRGLTIGSWIRPGMLPGTVNKGIMGKYETSLDQRSYLLYTSGTNRFRMGISGDGININNGATSEPFENGVWYFVVGRWIPSTSLDIWVNGVLVEQNTTSIISSIFNSDAPFMIGAYAGGAVLTTWTHVQSLCFLTATALSGSVIKSLHDNTKSLVGV